jgi:Ca2+-binding RTX toxin-like protein
VIYGYNANDTLIGGLGADELRGGKGKNKYSSAPDGAVDLIYVKKDNQVDKITTIGTEDRVVIGSSNITVSETSKGIGVFYKDRLQALYTGNDLSLSEFQALVV